MKWTTDQQEAIYARGGNLLLSAAAGSGKTSVLVERVIQLALEGTGVDRMLIVTFTRAAAADMKRKLIERLTDAASERAELRGQVARVERASILTIHAFCADLLRAHFEAAGVDPAFRVPEEAELNQIKTRALEEAVDAAYARMDGDMAALDYGRGVEQVSRLALETARFACARPDRDAFFQNAMLQSGAGGGAKWFNELFESARRALRDALALSRKALELCALPLGPVHYAPALQSDVDFLESALRCADYAALKRALDPYSAARLPVKRASKEEADPEKERLRALARMLRDQAKKKITAERDALIAPEDALEDIQKNAGALRALKALAEDYLERLARHMARRSLLSFDDLERYALIALSNEQVAQAVRARFDYVFVDEYQDVSDMQEAILSRVSRPDNLFMVGDVKQSIYRFRQAEPTLFIQKYHDYARGQGGRLIALRQNFRSRPSILHFTNRVFERLMRGGDSEVEYDEAARLRPGAAFCGEDEPVEIALLFDHPPDAPEDAAALEEEAPDMAQDAFDEDEGAQLTRAEREGAWIARRIKQLLGAPYYDAREGAQRSLRPRDFVVLVRARSAMAAIERALKAESVPVYVDAADGYLGAIEVRVALALLQVIENRRRDAELLSVLRSPIVDFSSTDLAAIRAGCMEGSFRDACLSCMADSKSELGKRLSRFEARLDDWRALSRGLPLSQLIDTALRESGYYAYVGAMPMGAQRQANLDLLITYASQFDQAQPGALTGFLRYILRIGERGDDMGAAHTLGENDDVVRVMTVHKSKGLEFPVVVAAQLGRALSRKGYTGELLIHRTLGAGMMLNDMDLSSRRDTLPRRAIARRYALEDLNEETRILYVLLTRAIDRLILVGSASSYDTLRLRVDVARGAALTSASYLDMLLPAAADFPGGEALGGSGAACGARVRLSLIHGAQLSLGGDAQSDAPPRADQPDEARVEAALRRLAWRYPFAGDELSPLKVTVTGLTREVASPVAAPPIERRPRFLTEDALTPTERGTLAHAALMGLELAPLRGLDGGRLRAQIDRQLELMLRDGRLYAPVDGALIQRFISSPTGQRMLRAGEVHREWAFTLRMDAREALPDSGAEGQEILVQGVIDCCFMEEGDWVLLDYKTDRASDKRALLERYRPQLALYARALSEITRRPVKQCLLCLLRGGDVLNADIAMDVKGK